MEKVIRAAVDRAEGDYYILIGDEDREEYLVPKSAADLCEGDLATLTYRDGVLIGIIPDPEGGAARRAANRDRLHSLFNRKK